MPRHINPEPARHSFVLRLVAATQPPSLSTLSGQCLYAPGDNQALGVLLCTYKKHAVVRNALGEEQQKKVFTSPYKLHLPSEAALRAELRRELKHLCARA